MLTQGEVSMVGGTGRFSSYTSEWPSYEKGSAEYSLGKNDFTNNGQEKIKCSEVQFFSGIKTYEITCAVGSHGGHTVS